MARSLTARFRPLLASAALLGVSAGCTYSNGDSADPDEATPQPCGITAQNVTYSGVISPIFDANCRGCHGSNVASTRGGGNDFSTYQSIERYPMATLLGTIEHAPSYSPMPKGRAKLSDCDIERIKAWIAAGKPNN
ncbi:MAG TPA: cytochrome c [Hymenobacter sp.]|uniref:c-type cytochrome n=1 Tax=Hymenobacter sp. TaxID=1898978 RepID=UPI002ED97FD8